MTTPLGEFIREARGEESQTDFAERAGISRAHLSEVERGKISLPGPDFRRKVASALGVTHIHLLIAAGELLPEEVSYAGAMGVVEEREDDPANEICALAKQLRPWPRSALRVIKRQLNDLIEDQDERKKSGDVKEGRT